MDKWDKLKGYINSKKEYPNNLDVNTLNAVLNAMGNYEMNDQIAKDIENKKPLFTVNHFQANKPRYIKELQAKCKHNSLDYMNDENMIELFCLDCGKTLFTHIKENITAEQMDIQISKYRDSYPDPVPIVLDYSTLKQKEDIEDLKLAQQLKDIAESFRDKRGD